MVSNNFLLFAAFICILGLNVINGEISTMRHSNQKEAVGIVLNRDFGMATGGSIKIDYKITASDSAEPYSSYALISIVDVKERTSWFPNLTPDLKSLSSDTAGTYCTQPSRYRQVVFGEGTIEYTVPSVDEYSILVMQCKTNTTANPINMYVQSDMRNIRPTGDGYSHLPIDEVMIPRVLEGCSIIYFLMIFGLAGQMFLFKENVKNIHYIFLGTLIACAASALSDYNYWYHLNKFGTQSVSVELTSNFFGFLCDFGLISSLLFLSMGWSLVRRNFLPRELQLASMSLLAYFCFGMADASCVDDNTSTCQALALVTLVVKSLLLLGIIVAMNYTVTLLKSMLYHSPWVPSTPVQYARSKQFQIFRIMFIFYLLLPTVFLLVKVSLALLITSCGNPF